MSGWETWQWDDTLFAGAAPYYPIGRLPYAPGLADAMAAEVGLDGTGRLLDVGCGPGVVALQLAHLYEHVVGLDPDGGMLAEAARLAATTTNVTWIQARAEELPGQLGTFRTITFGASFHWMDRPVVARAVHQMVEPGGAVVQVDAPAYRSYAATDSEHPPPPDEEIEALKRHYLGADTRAGQSIRNTSPSGEDEVFQAAGFAPARVVSVSDGRVLSRTVDQIVAMRLSSSSSAPHLFGSRLASFEGELRVLLGDGPFDVRLPDNILRIWVPG
jgi:SAM-dependent methyltransferase